MPVDGLAVVFPVNTGGFVFNFLGKRRQHLQKKRCSFNVLFDENVAFFQPLCFFHPVLSLCFVQRLQKSSNVPVERHSFVQVEQVIKERKQISGSTFLK